MPAEPLSEDTVETLRAWNERIWNRSRDRFGSTHAFANEKRPLTKRERQFILNLIEDHELPCVLHSGPYGNLSMSVFNHVDEPSLMSREHIVIQLSEEHMFGEDYRDNEGFSKWDKRFDAFAKYTHSERNRELCRFYGLPTPAKRERYEY